MLIFFAGKMWEFLFNNIIEVGFCVWSQHVPGDTPPPAPQPIGLRMGWLREGQFEPLPRDTKILKNTLRVADEPRAEKTAQTKKED